jgi:hypothetical protein
MSAGYHADKIHLTSNENSPEAKFSGSFIDVSCTLNTVTY